jgi:tetratricopeptide (TPR) repeat protein
MPWQTQAMRRIWLAFALVACQPSAPAASVETAAPAAAPAPTSETSAPEPSAEAPANAGDGAVDAEAAAACRERFRDLLSPQSQAQDAASLAAAAGCFAEAGAVGISIQLNRKLVESFPMSPEAKSALRQAGEAYEKVGHLADAARIYERYAELYAAEPDAIEKLERATCLRVSFDDTKSAEVNLAALERRYQKSVTLEALCPP